MRFISTLLALLVPAIMLAPAVAQTTNRTAATVVSTGDGDTLRVSQQGQTITVRLVCIDAPESNQPQGQQSAQRLAQLLPRGTAVQLRTVELDRYGRTVAEVYRNNQSLNLQMVQEGRAVVYQQYLDGCAADRDRYLQTEQQARQRRLAFWSQTNPVMPWDWRQGQQPTPVASPQPAPSTSASCDPSYPSICIPVGSPDLDCGQISYRRFTVRGADPHGFDSDNDGIGCES